MVPLPCASPREVHYPRGHRIEATLAAGWRLFVHSLRVFRKHPVFLVPILCAWCVYGPTIIYLRYFFPWKAVSLAEALGVVYLEVFVFSFVILCSSSVLLEMIRQLELGESLSVLQASGRLMQRDTLRILPLAFVWA